MQVLWETTDWVDNTPNHVYFMNDSKDKMYAYVTRGSADVFRFKQPIRIDTRGRTFIAVPNIWNFEVEEVKAKEQTQWTVIGSKGQKYIVKKEENIYTCTCPGYTFRGDCRHVKEKQSGS